MLIDPFCYDCKHIIDAKKKTCKAFPDGIPRNVMMTDIEHDKILPNQVGDYLFESIEKWAHRYK